MRWLLPAATIFTLVAAAHAEEAAPPRRIPVAPPAEIAALMLPDGELQPVVSYPDRAIFLDPGRTVKAGSVADVRTMDVYEPGRPTSYGLAVQLAQRQTIDCARRTITERGAVAFDEAGRMVLWLPEYPPKQIGSGTSADFLARMICDGAKAPGPAVQGHAAALAAVRQELRAAR